MIDVEYGDADVPRFIGRDTAAAPCPVMFPAVTACKPLHVDFVHSEFHGYDRLQMREGANLMVENGVWQLVEQFSANCRWAAIA